MARVRPSEAGATDSWTRWLGELEGRLRDARECGQLAARYVPEAWHPRVFHWPFAVPRGLFEVAWADPQFQELYRKAGHTAPAYGPPQLPWEEVRDDGQLSVRPERLHNLYHVWILLKTLPGMSLRKIKQVLEFGGGTGDMAATLFDLDFEGAHFVYDLPPMLLFQRYWLRYSGIPAFLGDRLVASHTASRGAIVLQSASDTGGIEARLAGTRALSSAFFGMWSFFEAAESARERIRHLIRNFGVLVLAFWDEFDGLDNGLYLRRFIAMDLNRTHEVFAWRHDLQQERVSWYLVAVHKALGKPRCVAGVNCAPVVVHPVVRDLPAWT